MSVKMIIETVAKLGWQWSCLPDLRPDGAIVENITKDDEENELNNEEELLDVRGHMKNSITYFSSGSIGDCEHFRQFRYLIIKKQHPNIHSFLDRNVWSQHADILLARKIFLSWRADNLLCSGRSEDLVVLMLCLVQGCHLSSSFEYFSLTEKILRSRCSDILFNRKICKFLRIDTFLWLEMSLDLVEAMLLLD